MNNSKRNFLKSIVATSALTIGATSHAVKAEPTSNQTTQLPKGKLLTFGSKSLLSPIYNQNILPIQGQHSILNSIDIQSGEVISTPLDMGGEGHMALGFQDGRILCTGHHQKKSLVTDPHHQTITSFEAPEGYVYGGHGLILEEQNVFLLPARKQVATKLQDTGIFEIYDINSLQLLDRINSGGIHPHEPHIIPGKNEIAVTHYGDMHIPALPLEHNVIDAKITIYDANTLAIKRHYVQNDLNAMTTHMQIDKNGFAYFVLTQYIKLNPEDFNTKQDLAIWEADLILKDIIGHVRDYNLTHHTLTEKRLSIPLPIVKVDTQTGERELIFTENKNHLRGQTVGINSLTNTIIAAYFHSDNLIFINNGKVEVIQSSHIGLQDIRGVVDIPNTPFVGVHGSEHNVAIMNVTSKEIITRHPSRNFYSVHVGYSPI